MATIESNAFGDVCRDGSNLLATTSCAIHIFAFSESSYTKIKNIDLPCANKWQCTSLNHTIGYINGTPLVACDSENKLYVIHNDGVIREHITSESYPQLVQADDDTMLIKSSHNVFYVNISEAIASSTLDNENTIEQHNGESTCVLDLDEASDAVLKDERYQLSHRPPSLLQIGNVTCVKLGKGESTVDKAYTEHELQMNLVNLEPHIPGWIDGAVFMGSALFVCWHDYVNNKREFRLSKYDIKLD